MAEHAVKCKHKPRFLETSLVTRPDGSVGFETLAHCEVCHEQICIQGGRVTNKFICSKCGSTDIVPCEKGDSSALEYICNACDTIW